MNLPSADFRTIPSTITKLATTIILSLASPNLIATQRMLSLSHRSPAYPKFEYCQLTRSTSTLSNMSSNTRTPIYFLSHGGPNIMYDSHPVQAQLQAIGREITQKVRPRAVVVFSAHWQGKGDVIEVNTAEKTDLIYDFYGFPEYYYKETFGNKGSPAVAQKVIRALQAAGIKTRSTSRGLDHGVWASFKVTFPETSNPLTVPIVQASLFDTEDAAMHIRLGRAVAPLRAEGIQIIVSGMAVHNLRDLRFGFGGPPRPYAASFDQALKEAVEAAVHERDEKLVALLKRSDARGAHPSFDHLLPIHVGAGAAGEDKGKRLWTKLEGSLGWALFKFGEVPISA